MHQIDIAHFKKLIEVELQSLHTLMDSAAIDKKIIHFESQLTLKALLAVLNQNVGERATDEGLIDVLATRWERIRGTSSCYTVAHLFNSANKICLAIAQKLAPLPDTADAVNELDELRGPYFLLMPSLLAYQDITGTNIHQYPFNEFILSEGERTFIPVKDCLSYAMHNNHGLTHLVCVDQATADYGPLTSFEMARIANHSQAAHDFLEGILKLQKARATGGFLGDRLFQLTVALRGGGEHARGPGRGRETDSGSLANEGIVAFEIYWNALTPEQQTDFFVQYPALEELLGRLFRPKDAEYLGYSYCVEVIANKLEILIYSSMMPRESVDELNTQCINYDAKWSRNVHIDYENKKTTPYPRVLTILFQRDVAFQRHFFRDTGSPDAWHYALGAYSQGILEFDVTDEMKRIVQKRRFSQGRTALMVAVNAGAYDAVDCLLKMVPESLNIGHHETHWTPLMFAMSDGDARMVEQLLAANPALDCSAYLYVNNQVVNVNVFAFAAIKNAQSLPLLITQLKKLAPEKQEEILAATHDVILRSELLMINLSNISRRSDLPYLFQLIGCFNAQQIFELLSSGVTRVSPLHYTIINMPLIFPDFTALMHKLRPEHISKLLLTKFLWGGNVLYCAIYYYPPAIPSLLEVVRPLPAINQNIIYSNQSPSSYFHRRHNVATSHYNRDFLIADLHYFQQVLLELQETLGRKGQHAESVHAELLYETLNTHLTRCTKEPNVRDHWVSLVQAVRQGLAEHGPSLAKVRGFKNIAANILLCLTGIGALFVLARVLIDISAGHQQYGFFKTKAGKCIDTLDDMTRLDEKTTPSP